jgi:arylsulfatase A
MGRWKGVRLNAIKNPDGPIELYDLSADIAETANLADRHPNITAMIAAIMKQEHQPNPNFPFYDTEQNNTQ